MAPGRKTGGRQAGTPNRATAAKAKEVEESGLTPLDFMLSVMRDEKRSTEDRFEAAKAAAPYVHPRLNAVAVQAGGDFSVRWANASDQDLLDRIRELDQATQRLLAAPVIDVDPPEAHKAPVTAAVEAANDAVDNLSIAECLPTAPATPAFVSASSEPQHPPRGAAPSFGGRGNVRWLRSDDVIDFVPSRYDPMDDG